MRVVMLRPREMVAVVMLIMEQVLQAEIGHLIRHCWEREKLMYVFEISSPIISSSHFPTGRIDSELG